METLTTAVDVRYPYFLESAKWQLCTKYMFEDDGWSDRKAITIQKYVSDFVEKISCCSFAITKISSKSSDRKPGQFNASVPQNKTH